MKKHSLHDKSDNVLKICHYDFYKLNNLFLNF